MLPGLGMIRRVIVLVLLGAAFVAGLKYGQTGQPSACRAVGGEWDMRGFCSGDTP